MCQGTSMRIEVLQPWNYNVKWLKNGEIIDTPNSPIFYATETGEYVAYCATEICPEDYSYSLSTSVTVVDCASMNLQNETNKKNISIFPNPTRAFINIIGFDHFNVLSVSIFEMKGKLVKEYSSVQIIKQVDVRQLPSGNYIIRLNGDGKVYNFKFVKK